MEKVVHIVVVTLLLAAWGWIPLLVDGPDPVPLCYPKPCAVR